MDFKLALLQGLDHCKYRNSIMVAPQGRRTKVLVHDPRKGFKLFTTGHSNMKKLFKANKKESKVDRSLACPNQQNKVNRELKVTKFPIKVAELFTYKKGKPYEKVTIRQVK